MEPIDRSKMDGMFGKSESLISVEGPFNVASGKQIVAKELEGITDRVLMPLPRISPECCNTVHTVEFGFEVPWEIRHYIACTQHRASGKDLLAQAERHQRMSFLERLGMLLHEAPASRPSISRFVYSELVSRRSNVRLGFIFDQIPDIDGAATITMSKIEYLAKVHQDKLLNEIFTTLHNRGAKAKGDDNGTD